MNKKKFLTAVFGLMLAVGMGAQNTFPFYESLDEGAMPASFKSGPTTGYNAKDAKSNGCTFTSDGMELTLSGSSTDNGWSFLSNYFTDPGTGIQIEYEFFQEGGTGVGISCFLYDADVTLTTLGELNYGLGYRYRRSTNTTNSYKSGLDGAYLCMAICPWGAQPVQMWENQNNIMHTGLEIFDIGGKYTGKWDDSCYDDHIHLFGSKADATVETGCETFNTVEYQGYPVLATAGLTSSSGNGYWAATLKDAGSITTSSFYDYNDSPTWDIPIRNLTFTKNPKENGYRKVYLILVPQSADDGTTEGYDVTVKLQTKDGISTIINQYHYGLTTTYAENATMGGCNATYNKTATLNTISSVIPDHVGIGFCGATQNTCGRKIMRELYISRPTAARAFDKEVVTNTSDAIIVGNVKSIVGIGGSNGAYSGTTTKAAYEAGVSAANIDLTKVEFYTSKKLSSGAVTMPYATAHGTWNYDSTTGEITFTPTDATKASRGVDELYYSIISNDIKFAGSEYRSNRALLTVTNEYYTVKFRNNDDSDNLAVINTMGYDVVLPSWPSDPTKTGYTFQGWYTEKDGAGTQYTATTVISDDVTLHPYYTPNAHNVIFTANGGEGADKSQAFNYDETKALTANTFTKDCNDFLGWASNSTATTAEYADGANYTLTQDNDVMLYAVWQLRKYTVTYKEADNTTTLQEQQVDCGATPAMLPAVPEKTGYTVIGWNTSANQTTANFTTANVITDNVTVYPAYTINTYNIFYNGNGSDGGAAPTDPTNAVYNSEVTVPSCTYTREGYTFKNWDTAQDESGTAYNAGDKFNMPAENVTLYAQWTINQYTLTYDANTATGSVPATATAYDYNEHVVVLGNVGTPQLEKEGYTFAGWNTVADGSGDAYAAGATLVVPSHNVTLYAQWSINSYNLSYNGNGNDGGSDPAAATSVTYNATVTALANTYTKTGYTFTGWKRSDNDALVAVSGTFSMPANDVVLVAQWQVNTYTVTFINQDNTTTFTTRDVEYGAAIGIANFPTVDATFNKTGYTFAGWNTVADQSTANFNASTVYTYTTGIKLYPVYTLDSNLFTLVESDHGTYSGKSHESGTTVPYNTTVTVTANPKEGYEFDYWMNNGSKDLTNTTAVWSGKMPAGNLTLEAIYKPINYTVKFDGNGASTVVMADQAFTYDVDQTLSNNTFVREGYTFAGWNTVANGSGTAYNNQQVVKNLTSTKDAEVILYAQWAVNSYTVTYLPNGAESGDVPAVATAYNFDAVVTILGNTGNLAKVGYTFDGWTLSVDGTTKVAGNTFNMPATDVTLTAIWTINKHQVLYDGNGNTAGTAPTDATLYNYNTTVIVKDKGDLEKTGYSFNGWNTVADGSGDAYAVGASLTMGPDADITLYAQWVINQYTVEYLPTNAESGNVPTGKATYDYNAEVTILGNVAAEPLYREGYTFAGWKYNIDGTTKVAGNTFNMPAANVTLSALWTINSYSLTYDGNGNTAGAAPTDANSPYDYKSDFVVLDTLVGFLNEGHKFAGWKDGDGNIYAVGNTYQMPSHDVVLYAQWATLHYTISFKNTNNTDNIDQKTLDYGAAIGSTGIVGVTEGSNPWTANVVGAPSKTGYTFVGWNTAADQSTANFTDADWTMPAHSVVLYPAFEVNRNTLWLLTDSEGHGHYSTSGENANVTHSETTNNVAYGTPIYVEAQAIDGYAFNYWLVNGSQEGNRNDPTWSGTMPDGDLTLKAVYQKLYNVIEVVLKEPENGNGYVNKDANIWPGEVVTIIPNSTSGYAVDIITVTTEGGNNTTICDIYTEDEAKDSYNFNMPSDNVTVTIVYGIDDDGNGVVDMKECDTTIIVVKKFDDILVCSNVADTLTNYQWYKQGQPISGATLQFLFEEYGLVGRYYVLATDINGNVHRSCAIEYNCPVIPEEKVVVYPNPVVTEDGFTVECKLPAIELENASIMIYSEGGVPVVNDTQVTEKNYYKLHKSKYVGKVITSSGMEYTFKVNVVK